MGGGGGILTGNINREGWNIAMEVFVGVAFVNAIVLFSYTIDPVTHVALSSDAKCVLASTLDSTLRLLDHQTGECLTAWVGYSFAISSELNCVVTFGIITSFQT